MAKTYLVKWKTVETSGAVIQTPVEKTNVIEFEDVQFKEFYIRATDDDTGKTYIIPYVRIYDIEITGEDPVNYDFGHP